MKENNIDVMKIENVTCKDLKEYQDFINQLKNCQGFIKSRGLKQDILFINESTVILVNLTGKNLEKKIINLVYNITIENK